MAKSRRPKLTVPATTLLVRSYVGLRAETLQPGGTKSARVTVRSLESLIRLSEAIAKVKFAEEVTAIHVEEALRLMYSSLLKLERNTITLDDSGAVEDDTEMNNGMNDHGKNHQRIKSLFSTKPGS